jgi:hypothetical protein
MHSLYLGRTIGSSFGPNVCCCAPAHADHRKRSGVVMMLGFDAI